MAGLQSGENSPTWLRYMGKTAKVISDSEKWALPGIMQSAPIAAGGPSSEPLLSS